MSKAQILLDEVLKLSREEKEVVLSGLMDDMEDYFEDDDELREEVLQRIEEVESGKVKGIPWDEAMKMVREKINAAD